MNKDELKKILKIDEKKDWAGEIEKQMADPNFWSDQEKAKILSEELSAINKIVSDFEVANTEEEIEELKKLALFSGEYDNSNAIVSIHAGAGGTEAQDWAEMLYRMFERWARKHNFACIEIDKSVGEEAGLKSVTFQINGYNAFGWLKSESGVHRLVRISPFDADKSRHTSFALVDIIPQIQKDTDIQINDKDLEISTFRSGGHGGQNVNKVETAVRIKHTPSNITVSCQKERSQAQNKEIALGILKSKLLREKLAKQEEEKQELRGEFHSPEWGSQIRSYVLHPYKMVKDHRTNFESSDPDSVLDGNLDEFMLEYLKSR